MKIDIIKINKFMKVNMKVNVKIQKMKIRKLKVNI